MPTDLGLGKSVITAGVDSLRPTVDTGGGCRFESMSARLQMKLRTITIPTSSFTPVRSGLLQRRSTTEAESSRVSPVVHDVLRSPGQPLDAETRAFMEPRFGHDFSRVRVHADSKAAESARLVGAQAYTVGQDVVFGTGHYAPGTIAGRGLLAHELVHVVQQGQVSGGDPGSEAALETEASEASQRAASGEQTVIRHSASQDQLQFERIRFRGREFEVGDVHLHGRASVDVRQHRVLFTGPDHAHILVTGDGRLGYEVAHTSPADPFRWERLKYIVDNGHVDIFAVTFPGEFRVKEVTPDTRRVVKRTLFSVGGDGITLPRESLYSRIYPSERTFTASPRDDRDTIYYESGAGGCGLIGGNALAHELFGHLWLAMQGVPFLHPTSLEEAERRAHARGETLSAEERRRVMSREMRLGRLHATHGIRDPFGRIYIGTVREYIERYAGASTTALGSLTLRVSEAHLEAALEEFHRAALAPGGLTRSGRDYAISEEVALQWEYLSNNYEVLWHIREGRRPAWMPEGEHYTPPRLSEPVKRLVVEWYRTEFNDDQRYAFRNLLSRILTDPRLARQRRLARDVQAEIRGS